MVEGHAQGLEPLLAGRVPDLGGSRRVRPGSGDARRPRKRGVPGRGVTGLHCDEPVVHLDLLGEEVGADGGLVLVAELLVHVPARRGGRPGDVSTPNRHPLGGETTPHTHGPRTGS